MTEATEKKVKIFNLAKDLNLASGTIIEFLTKKGYTIKGPMSIVENDMMKDIMSHFKKDKDVADRHQRKIAEIKETKRKTAEKKKESEEETKEVEKKKADEVAVEVVAQALPSVEEAPDVHKVEPTILKPVAVESTTAPSKEEPQIVPVEKPAPEKAEERAPICR